MNFIFIIITGILGASLTYFVSENLKQGSVRASALLSLIVGLFFYIFPEIVNPYLTENIPFVFMGTSFIGMVSSKVKINYIVLVLAGSFFSIIFTYKSAFFDGYGGALGTLAFVSLLTTIGFSRLFSSKIKA